MGGIPLPQCWWVWTYSHAPLLWKQPFRCLLAWASLQTLWTRPSPNLEVTLSGAKPDWGIPLLGTKPESYGGALLVQMYELRSPNEGPLPKPHKVSQDLDWKHGRSWIWITQDPQLLPGRQLKHKRLTLAPDVSVSRWCQIRHHFKTSCWVPGHPVAVGTNSVPIGTPNLECSKEGNHLVQTAQLWLAWLWKSSTVYISAMRAQLWSSKLWDGPLARPLSC